MRSELCLTRSVPCGTATAGLHPGPPTNERDAMELKPDPWLAEMFAMLYWGPHAPSFGTVGAHYVEAAIADGRRVRYEDNRTIDEELFFGHRNIRDTPWPVLLRPYLYGEPVTEEWVAAYTHLKLTS